MTFIPKTSGTFQSFDGTPIYYEVHGEGEPLVLAYGIACLMNHWNHQVRHFSPRYKVILFDYRAHHRSGVPEDPQNLSIEALVEDIKRLCQMLGVEKASFWGHSFGAQILLALYNTHPDLFKSLVLINGFAKNPLKGMFGSNITEKIFEYVQLLHRSFPGNTSMLWKNVVQNPILIPISGVLGGFNLRLAEFKDIEIYARGVASLPLEGFIPLFEQMVKYDGSYVIDKITVPTLIISGAGDSLTPQSIQWQFHHRIKQSEFLIVPQGSHCTQLDMPDLVNLRIEKFLKDQQELPVKQTDLD